MISDIFNVTEDLSDLSEVAFNAGDALDAWHTVDKNEYNMQRAMEESSSFERRIDISTPDICNLRDNQHDARTDCVDDIHFFEIPCDQSILM